MGLGEIGARVPKVRDGGDVGLRFLWRLLTLQGKGARHDDEPIARFCRRVGSIGDNQ
jgi:hypothetical protein